MDIMVNLPYIEFVLSGTRFVLPPDAYARDVITWQCTPLVSTYINEPNVPMPDGYAVALGSPFLRQFVAYFQSPDAESNTSGSVTLT